MTRLLVYTGRGGAGVTTCSAASARHLARNRTTALVSLDPTGALSEIFDTEVGPEPTRVRSGLTAVEINPQAGQDTYRDTFARIADTASAVGIDLTDGHVASLLESTHVPFGREVAALEAVASFVGDSTFDAVVFDTSLQGRLFRLLQTPGLFGQGVDIASMAIEEVGDRVEATTDRVGERTTRLVAMTDPIRDPLGGAFGPVDSEGSGSRHPSQEVSSARASDEESTNETPGEAPADASTFEESVDASTGDESAVARDDRELVASRVAAVREVLGGEGSRELRIVTTPDRVAAGWTDHLLQNLRRAGIPAGPLVVNKVVEDGTCCGRCAAVRAEQQSTLSSLRARDDLDLRTLPDLHGEVTGDARLERLASELLAA